MLEYISKDEMNIRIEKAIDDAKAVERDAYHHGIVKGLEKAMDIVDSIKIRFPIRGRWVHVIGDDYECSNCKAALWARKVYPVDKYKFCWSCGAKMDLPETTKG